MPPCLPCSAQWHFECVDIQIQAEGELTVGFLCCCSENNGPTVITPTPEAPNGRKLKEADEVRDITSTGRKRAAQVKPIEAGMVCEWAGLKYAGGGVLPIIGCEGNLATNIHHGPDKNTLNNEWENLHRICATCVSANMRLLTEDLRWVEAKNIKPGDRLIGFSEQLAHSVTKFEPAVVESVMLVRKPGYKITMKNGDVLTVSEDHQWVANRPSDQHAKWVETKQFMKRRSEKHYALKKLVQPWEHDKSWESGWLAGFLDGEGSLSGYSLHVSQTDKEGNDITTDMMYEAMFKFSSRINETQRRANGVWSEAWVLRISNLPEILTLLGTVRPERLISKIPNFMYKPGNGRSRPKSPLTASRQEIEKVDFIGEQEFYSIQTSSSTYIVEGYLSHNCHNRWHEQNDPFYGERPQDGTAFLPLSGEMKPHDPETKATEEEIANYEKKWKKK